MEPSIGSMIELHALIVSVKQKRQNERQRIANALLEKGVTPLHHI